MAMKELKMFNFLIKFGLSDLKLMGIDTKIIKIGPEMPILQQFVGLSPKTLDFYWILQLVYT